MTFESRSLAKLHDMVPRGPYAVAVSGGVDSMTLMALTALLRKDLHPGCPTILTVNHGFRPEAAKETDFVQTRAQILGLKCCILNCNYSTSNKSQDTARKIRYGLISGWCLENSVPFVLTAHTKNDQAETVLLRLERGSGIDGLVGMRERVSFNDIVILRPLLDFTREEILTYASDNNLTWIEDPSNNNPTYKRTFYRRFLNEHSESYTLVNRLCLTAQHMHKALSCILQYVQKATETCLEFHDLGYISIKTRILRGLPEEVARRLLLMSFMTVGHKDLKPRYAKFLPAFSKIWARQHFKPFTISGCKVVNVSDDQVIVAREVARISQQTYLRGQQRIRWDNRFELSLHSISNEGILRALKLLYADQRPREDSNTLRHSCQQPGLDEELWVAPLDGAPIPDSLRHIHKDVVKGLPVLVYRGKVIAYPLQKDSIHDIPSIKLEKVLLKERLVSLVRSQL